MASHTYASEAGNPDDVLDVADAGAPGHAPPPGSSLTISIEDWDFLFGAILTRLRLNASGHAAATPQSHATARLLRVVLECVEALDLLQAALRHERRVRAQLEADVPPRESGRRNS